MNENTLEKREYEAGGGMWIHAKTGEQVLVTVQFYPKTVLRIKGNPIPKCDLIRNYHRLKL